MAQYSIDKPVRLAVTLQDIRDAAEIIRGGVVDTPCIHSHTLSKIVGAEVILKHENLQFTGSFKDRGALVMLLSLTSEQRQQGVIAMSAGNHAQAVAYHAQRLDIPAVIIMPRFTPNTKIERTRGFGAEVILFGDTLDDSSVYANKLASERNLHIVHPYDDPKIIAGQGTVALEMLTAYPDMEILVVPVGGGGLISGNVIAAKALRPDIEVIGVETARFPSMLRALEGSQAEFGTATIAEGIAVKQPGQLTIPIVRQLVDELLLVHEDNIEQAVLLLLEIEKTVAEGAGAVSLAALLKHSDRFAGRKVGLIISGGNIDLSILSTIIRRGLVRSGRLMHLTVDVRDVPGALAEVTTRIGETGASIAQVTHQRTFSHLSLELVEVEFVLHTRGLDHVHEVITTLKNAGYNVSATDIISNR